MRRESSSYLRFVELFVFQLIMTFMAERKVTDQPVKKSMNVLGPRRYLSGNLP